jgi:uncharacterized membrane protein
MKHKFFWTALFVILAVGVLAACTQTATEAPTADKSEAEILIDERCSTCHSANKVYSENLSQEEWSVVFDNMIAKGADVNDTEKALMIDWLVAGN